MHPTLIAAVAADRHAELLRAAADRRRATSRAYPTARRSWTLSRVLTRAAETLRGHLAGGGDRGQVEACCA